jgi:hypothetical protein
MAATKHPIHLSPAGIDTGASELSAPDFTEVRNVPRPFPKDAGERDCYRFLLGQMQAASDRPHVTKAEFENTCRRRFFVTASTFKYCWREAVNVSGVRWDQPGRPPGRKFSG